MDFKDFGFVFGENTHHGSSAKAGGHRPLKQNNRILLKQVITKQLLKEDFYNWSNRKKQYTNVQIENGFTWLKKNDFEPSGFGQGNKTGKEIKQF